MARGHFAKAEKQAASVMKEMQGQGNAIESVGTARNYEQALKSCAEYLKEYKLGSLREITPNIATQYLHIRSTEVSQKTLNMDRQALQSMMQNVTHQLSPSQSLEIVKSERETIEKSRAYSNEQVQRIISHQSDKHALTTQICHQAGLRAHEMFTLRPVDEQKASPREVHPQKFSHLAESKTYTVNGKGGLIREVKIPIELAEKLEARRFQEPQKVTDRGVFYTSHYDVAGGLNFSSAFSKASQRGLGFSHGAHGLRHSYAQDRFEKLSWNIKERDDVLKIVSQELGHFRPEITEVYLR